MPEIYQFEPQKLPEIEICSSKNRPCISNVIKLRLANKKTLENRQTPTLLCLFLFPDMQGHVQFFQPAVSAVQKQGGSLGKKCILKAKHFFQPYLSPVLVSLYFFQPHFDFSCLKPPIFTLMAFLTSASPVLAYIFAIHRPFHIRDFFY